MPTPLEPVDHPTAQENPPGHQHARQFALQCAAAFLVLSVAWPFYGLRNQAMPWPETAFAMGAAALLLASLTRQPWWWRLIHALFAPLAWGASALAIAPGWFLLAFILMLLVYRGAVTGQIPLYLSNRACAVALYELVADRADLNFIDLGAGIGSVLLPLSRKKPEAQFTGIENAPATWLVGYLRTAGLSNCRWRWGDIWQIDLAPYNVVYAFLSPAAMFDLWAKARHEMSPGSLFISNSFPVPDLEATAIIDLDDARQTRLYCYQR